MKTKDVITENSNVTSKEAVLSQQLSEALRLIRQLQRNNAELISQNANLMKTNSRLTIGNSNCITNNDDESFVNDILSRITDNSGTVIENKQSVKDNSVTGNDSKSSIIDNKRSVNDNSVFSNDNSFADNDDSPSVTDNKPEQIEIYGKMFDREAGLDMLRFEYNIKGKQNLTDEQILTTIKNASAEFAKRCENKKREKILKVPALYYLTHDPVMSRGRYKGTFDKVLCAYRKLKYRSKNNTPSLARQVKMLLYLYQEECGCPKEIFSALNLISITGFRYAAKLREYGLINCHSRGTACQYTISEKGKQFLENASL